MFGIDVELLTGTYCATRHNDRVRPEWPPHPQRLFAAMVAAWADTDQPDDGEAAALRWFESLQPPQICCSPASSRSPVTSFVPVNDSTVVRSLNKTYEKLSEAIDNLRRAAAVADPKAHAKALRQVEKLTEKIRKDSATAATPHGSPSQAIVDAGLTLLPEHRGRQARTYPTALPDIPRFRYQWPDAETNPAEPVLDALLARVHRLGHSSTLVSCRVRRAEETPALVPQPSGRESIRVTGPGLLNELCETYIAANHGTEPRVLPTRFASYDHPHVAAALATRSNLAGDFVVLNDTGGRSLSIRHVVAVATAVRDALMAHSPDPPPPFISGHQPLQAPRPDSPRAFTAPTPPLQSPHLAILALPYVASSHADGTIFGVALALPDPDDAERQVLFDTLARWAAAGGAGEGMVNVMLPGGYRLVLGYGNGHRGPATLEPATWCRPSREWTTVTPIALDRHPGNMADRNSRRAERAADEARHSVATACRHLGLPEPVSVDVDRASYLRGAPSCMAYPNFRSGGNGTRALVHARIRFDEPVTGPVVLGAGRYRGLGLCRPCSTPNGFLR